MTRTRRAVLALLVLLTVASEAPQAQRRLLSFRIRRPVSSNPIAAARLPGGDATLPNPSWAAAGAGTIPARSTICNTLGTGGQALAFSQSVSAATINSAISGCTTGQTVLLNPGTYSLSAKLTLASNVTLRGSGPNQTKVSFTAGSGSCGAISAFICFPGPNADGESCCVENVASWTAGYAQGATLITLSANTTGASKPVVGTVLMLDQVVDGNTVASDLWPDVFTCMQGSTVCIQSGSTPYSGRPGSGATAREQFQAVSVTAISGGACPCAVTVTPPIKMPNWRTGQTPQAFWAVSSMTHDAGLEDMWIENNASSSDANVGINWGHHIWIKNVKSVSTFGGSSGSSLKNIIAYYTSNVTVRDSYIFNGTEPRDQDAYGVDCFVSGNMLIENNIIQKTRAPIIGEQCEGMVNAYNYAIHMVTADGDGWDFSGIDDNHGNSGNHWLIEGDDDTIINVENYHGVGQFTTIFRNHMVGQDAAAGTHQNAPILIYGYNRFPNVLGNVLGNASYHTTYESNPSTGDTNCNHSIYGFGFGDNCTVGNGTNHPLDDSHLAASVFRWGNWDTVTSSNDNGTNDSTGTKFTSGEVPTGIGTYANTVPASQTLPNSLYLSAKPSFFGSVTWPPIGPDVSNGDIANTGGHAYRNPARTCFEDVMGGAFADTTAKTFVGWNGGGC